MSIDEAAALKAVQDGLAGRNVPIVHEEIRVVLAMALERDVLKARAETAERELDLARGLIARLGDADALESLNALLTLERANHLSARARVAELERERDEAAASRQNGQALRAFLDETGHARRVVERIASLERDLAEARLRVCTTAIGCGECERCRAVASAARLRDALGKYGDHAPCCDYAERALYEDCACGFRDALASAPSAEPEGHDRELASARADAERLREALEALVEYERKRHPPKMGGDHLPPTLREVMDIARAALASAPRAEPTPRDMRVAEAVREACVETADASDEASRRVAGDLRDLDLAAVVAKAVGT